MENVVHIIILIIFTILVTAITVTININRHIEEFKEDIDRRLFDMQGEVERMRNSVEKQEFDQKEVRILLQEIRLLQERFAQYDIDKVNKIALTRKK